MWHHDVTNARTCQFFRRLFDRLPVRISTSDLHHRILLKKRISELMIYDKLISELMILECSFPLNSCRGWSREDSCRVFSLVTLLLRARSHGCKIWLKVGGALQFPWTLQRNLAAAARSAKKREAARRAAFRFFALQLQKLQRSRSMRENARSCSFG